METLYLIGGTGLSLLFLGLLFIPMEKTFPARPGQKILRKGWRTDLCYFLGQYLLWGSAVTWLLAQFSFLLDDMVSPDLRAFVRTLPVWGQAICVMVLSDIFIYWAHRLQHRVGFLWRFHKVHHSAQHLDWLAAHREHPLDSVYTIGIINLPAFILGFSLESLSWLIAFRGIWAIYIHSNVRLNIGPLKWLIGSPDLHHWHHDLDRDRGNYANISPLLDILFGTYTCPDHEPSQLGIRETFPKTYLGQLLQPLGLNLKPGTDQTQESLSLSGNTAGHEKGKVPIMEKQGQRV